MSGDEALAATPRWEQFVVEHGFRARAAHLAAVVGVSAEAVLAARQSRPCVRLDRALEFHELFALWHGRAPDEQEWPAPAVMNQGYEWLAPEIALLATLVGQLSAAEIAVVLTQRLKRVTGDQQAERTAASVQIRTNLIGMQSCDVVGGIVVADAAREIDSRPKVAQAIRSGLLKPFRRGRLLVIPHEQWAKFKAGLAQPPQGFIRLSTLREPLGIRSDSKLPEFASMGYVPTAVFCGAATARSTNNSRGTWYVDKQAAEKLIADRHAGRPMPWHGKPLLDNLRVTYRRWQERIHPESCATCAQIWGEKGVPTTFEDYVHRYHDLDHGAKRHLTRVWTPGMTVAEVAAACSTALAVVQQAIDGGALPAQEHGGCTYVTRTEATRWLARKCPTGESERSWVSLDTACSQYMFTLVELHERIAQGELKSRVGDAGAARGVVYVLRHQYALLREKLGFTLAEAARRAGVSTGRMQQLLDGVNWRGAQHGIPLVTLQAVIKRIHSHNGYSLQEAADVVGESEEWVRARISDGTVRVSAVPWDNQRLYLTEPMVLRLQAAAQAPRKATLDPEHWLHLSEAARDAGVSTGTLQRWGQDGDLQWQDSPSGCRYLRSSVRARARRYWHHPRLHRAQRPQWLQDELAAQEATESGQHGEGAGGHSRHDGANPLPPSGRATNSAPSWR